MNPTLSWLANELRFRLATRNGAIRKLVRADIDAGPPRTGEKTAGQKTLAAVCAHGGGHYPYYVAQTATALAIAVASGVGACWLAAARESGNPWTAVGSAALGAIAAMAFYQAVARRCGPRVIDQARLEDARTALARSGDPQTVISGPVQIVLLLLALLDGCMAGTTISAAALGTLLSPTQALIAGIGFSLVLTSLLFHLAQAAAREAAINKRRNLVRALLASPRPADADRAKDMIDAVGNQLGRDYSRRANRYAMRATLFLLVLALAAGTFVVRVRAESMDVNLDAQAVSTP